MFLLLCLILFIWGVAGLCSDYDHEAEVRNAHRDAERRHKETLNALRCKGTTRITEALKLGQELIDSGVTDASIFKYYGD